MVEYWTVCVLRPTKLRLTDVVVYMPTENLLFTMNGSGIGYVRNRLQTLHSYRATTAARVRLVRPTEQ